MRATLRSVELAEHDGLQVARLSGVLDSDERTRAGRDAGCYLRTGSELGQKRAVEIGRPLKNAFTD